MNNQPSGPEKRKHPRLEKNIPVKLSCEDAEIVTETKNISRSGAYCRVSKYIAPMTKMKIHLLLPFFKNEKTVTKKVTCDGVVVRTESIPGKEDYNIAIYFNNIGNKDATEISRYIEVFLSKNRT